MKEDTEKWGGIIILPNERLHGKTGRDYKPTQQKETEKWGGIIIPPNKRRQRKTGQDYNPLQ